MGGKTGEKSKSKFTDKIPAVEGQQEEESAIKEKLWTFAEQRKFLLKLATFIPQVEEPERTSVGEIDSVGCYLDLSRSDMNVINSDKLSSINIQPDVVRFLYLSENNLCELPSGFFQLFPNLVWLDLRRNYIDLFPTRVENHASLETLLLQDNRLAILPLELGSLENLKCLMVSGNPLEFPNSNTIITCLTDVNLIDYLRRCWQSRSTDVPPLAPGISTEEKTKEIKQRIQKRQKQQKLRNLTEIVCEKKDSSKIIDQVVAEKITSELRAQDKILQKARDRDVLKNWRDRRRYSEKNLIALIQPPPFDVDKNEKMPTRREYSLHMMKKTKPKRHPKQNVNLATEIEELKKSLQKMALKRQTNDPNKEMATRLNEMKAIKEVQRKIAALKKLN